MPSRFSIFLGAAVCDQRLTDGDIRVLAGLATFSDRGGNCWPSVAKIAIASGCNSRSVQRSMLNLERLGYVARTTRWGRSNTYVVKLDTHDREVAPLESEGVTVESPTPDPAVTQNVPSNAPTTSSPSSAEREMREALGSPDAILVMESFAGIGSRAFARWAAVRQYGPGGISEKPGVTWNTVAAGLLGAASYTAEHPDKPLSERLIGSCIQRAAQPFQDAPRRPIAAGVRDWAALHQEALRAEGKLPQ